MFFKGLIGALTALISCTAWAQIGVIDDFSTSQVIEANVEQPIVTGQVPGDMLGGERDLQLSFFTSVPMPPEFLSVSVEVGDEVTTTSDSALSVSNDVTVTSIAQVIWDGVDGNGGIDPDGLGGLDFTGGGFDEAFQLAVLSVDNNIVGFEIEVFSGPGNSSVTGMMLTNIMSPQDFIFPFDAFTVASGTGADFTSVGAITLTIDTNTTADAGADLAIESFGVVENLRPIPPGLPVAVPAMHKWGVLIMAILVVLAARRHSKRLIDG